MYIAWLLLISLALVYTVGNVPHSLINVVHGSPIGSTTLLNGGGGGGDSSASSGDGVGGVPVTLKINSLSSPLSPVAGGGGGGLNLGSIYGAKSEQLLGKKLYNIFGVITLEETQMNNNITAVPSSPLSVADEICNADELYQNFFDICVYVRGGSNTRKNSILLSSTSNAKTGIEEEIAKLTVPSLEEEIVDSVQQLREIMKQKAAECCESQRRSLHMEELLFPDIMATQKPCDIEMVKNEIIDLCRRGFHSFSRKILN